MKSTSRLDELQRSKEGRFKIWNRTHELYRITGLPYVAHVKYNDVLEIQESILLQYEEGNNELHNAASSGSIVMVEDLIKIKVDVNVQNNYGCTALHFASAAGNLQCVRLLVANNAKVDIKDSEGKTASHYAKGYDRNDIIKVLDKSRFSIFINNCFNKIKSAANSTSIKIKENWDKHQIKIIRFCAGYLELCATTYILMNYTSLSLKFNNIFEKSINLFKKVIDSPSLSLKFDNIFEKSINLFKKVIDSPLVLLGMVAAAGCTIYLGIQFGEKVKRTFIHDENNKVVLEIDNGLNSSRQNAGYGR